MTRRVICLQPLDDSGDGLSLEDGVVVARQRGRTIERRAARVQSLEELIADPQRAAHLFDDAMLHCGPMRRLEVEITLDDVHHKTSYEGTIRSQDGSEYPWAAEYVRHPAFSHGGDLPDEQRAGLNDASSHGWAIDVPEGLTGADAVLEHRLMAAIERMLADLLAKRWTQHPLRLRLDNLFDADTLPNFELNLPLSMRAYMQSKQNHDAGFLGVAERQKAQSRRPMPS